MAFVACVKQLTDIVRRLRERVVVMETVVERRHNEPVLLKLWAVPEAHSAEVATRAAFPVDSPFLVMYLSTWDSAKGLSKGTADRGIAMEQGTTTPFRLSLPVGSYSFHLANPNYPNPLVIAVEIKGNQTQNITRPFPGFDRDGAAEKF